MNEVYNRWLIKVLTFILTTIIGIQNTTINESKKVYYDETIDGYVDTVCELYDNVDPQLVRSIIWHESRYDPEATNGNCLGLMQISTYWHADRACKLGVVDFYDPYSNILLGVDYLSEMLDTYDDTTLVLMLYNMRYDTAFELYNEGIISEYASSVLTMTEELKQGVIR